MSWIYRFWAAGHLGFWDLILVVAVSAEAVALAYLYEPKWKAFVYTLPIPFTLATLALGRPVDATNVLGLALQIVFTQGVRLLRQRLHLPIVPAIAAGTALYSLLGWAIAGVLPDNPLTFWLSCTLVLALGALGARLLPPRAEQGHASALPIWLKVPLTAVLILLLMRAKGLLGGFATLFPMVGVFAAYEARHSLWTLGRQIPIFMLRMTPTLIVIRLMQTRFGLGLALAAGWAVFLILIPLVRLPEQGSAPPARVEKGPAKLDGWRQPGYDDDGPVRQMRP